MSATSRASIASIARYWAEAPELADISHTGSPTVADLRFCLERCAELLAAFEPAAAEGRAALAAWDKYEPDISREGTLRQSHPKLQIDMIGGNCPVQAEGTVNGVPFYFRARGQRWTFSAGQDPVAICTGRSGGFHYEEPYGAEKYDAGWMSEEEADGFIRAAAQRFHEASTNQEKDRE